MQKMKLLCGVIIFSKDRPMQLHLLLETMTLYVKGTSVTYILYKDSNTIATDGYKKLELQFSNLHFVKETDFQQDLLTLLSNPIHSHICFLVDDCIFLNSINLDDIYYDLTHRPQVIGFSLRLGYNTTKCHTLNRKQRKPYSLSEISSSSKNKHQNLLWDWKQGEADFGYPLEVSSSVYTAAFIANLCRRFTFSNPNSFELQMNLYKNKLHAAKPWLMSFTQSRACCIPLNLTQDQFQNRHMDNSDYSVENLLRLFAQGQRVDVPKLLALVASPNAAHVEIPHLPLFKISVKH